VLPQHVCCVSRLRQSSLGSGLALRADADGRSSLAYANVVLLCVQLWDLKTNKLLREWKEHTAEVYAVDWNLVNKEQLLSGAWDNVSFLSAATATPDAS